MKNLWSWVVLVVLIIVLGFGVYYGWHQKYSLESMHNDLNNIRNELVNPNNSLQNSTSNSINSLPSAGDQAPSGLTVKNGVFIQNDYGFQVNIPNGYQYQTSPPNGLSQYNYEKDIYNVAFFNDSRGYDAPNYDSADISVLQCSRTSSKGCLAQQDDWPDSTFEKSVVIDGKTAGYYDSTKTAGTAAEYVVSDGKLRFLIRGGPESPALKELVQSFKFI